MDVSLCLLSSVYMNCFSFLTLNRSQLNYSVALSRYWLFLCSRVCLVWLIKIRPNECPSKCLAFFVCVATAANKQDSHTHTLSLSFFRSQINYYLFSLEFFSHFLFLYVICFSLLFFFARIILPLSFFFSPRFAFISGDQKTATVVFIYLVSLLVLHISVQDFSVCWAMVFCSTILF